MADEEKQEVKEEAKEEIKEEAKEEVKSETKEEPKAEVTPEAKAEVKPEAKEEPKAKAVEEKKPKAPRAKKSAAIEDIITKIKGMTVLELVELVKALEDEFGVSAAAPVAVAAAAAPAAGEAVAGAEEKTEFTVVLTEVGANKINVIKAVRELTSLGLKESKDLVEGAPKPVKEGINKDEAAAAKAKLEAAGAKAEVK